MNEQLTPEQEGRKTVKIMQDCFKSFGLSDKEANTKIGALVSHVQSSNGSFTFLRIRDVVYTVEVTGVNQVEIHAIPGGSSKQDDKYRVKKLEQTLPNALAVLQQLGTQVVYVTMPKKDSKPYDKIMEEFGFAKRDIPEEVGAADLIAYIARIQ
jgi:hypothetical protein